MIPRFAGIEPAEIVRCESPEDVAGAVALARKLSLPVVVRGGGHDFAGRSSTTGVRIDTAPLDGIRPHGDRVTVGGGALLGPIYDALAAVGRIMPAGCGPTVGVAGLTLGGGLGILGRGYGLTCDALREATVVLADGSRVTCDAEREPDLFWLLRGGGAPGVVTELVFETLPEPELTGFLCRFPSRAAADVLAAWQTLAPAAPDTLAASLVLSAASDPDRPIAVTVFGATGDEGALDDLLAGLGVAPVQNERHAGRARAVKRWLAGVDPHDGPEPEGGHAYLRSEFHRSAVPATDLVACLAVGRRAGESRELDFSPWAGAYCRVPADATAFPHRDAAFLLKHAATVEPGAAPGPWPAASYAITHPWGTGGVYPNFPEPDLPDDAYYLGNAERVRAVRDRYDPDGVFAPR